MGVGASITTTPVYSCTIATSDPSSGTIQAVLPGSTRQVTVQGTPVAFRWPVAGEVWRIIKVNGSYYLDAPLPIQDNSSTAAMSTTDITLGTLSTGISSNTAYDTLPVEALGQSIGQSPFTLSDPTGVYTQSWTTSGASEGATSLPVASQTPIYEFPEGSTIIGSGVTTINDIDPGDAVINAPTGKVWVMGSQDGSTDWNFDGEVGGDVSGPLDDISLVAQPYFYGYWVATTVTGRTQLLCTDVPYKQAGMKLSGGGCEVPKAGLYDIQVKARIDNESTPPSASYIDLYIEVNGDAISYTVDEDSSISGQIYPYHVFDISMTYPLNAGDVVTVVAAQAGAATSPYADLATGDGLFVTYRGPYTGV